MQLASKTNVGLSLNDWLTKWGKPAGVGGAGQMASQLDSDSDFSFTQRCAVWEKKFWRQILNTIRASDTINQFKKKFIKLVDYAILKLYITVCQQNQGLIAP